MVCARLPFPLGLPTVMILLLLLHITASNFRVRFALLNRRWRQNAPPKLWYITTYLHDVTFQKKATFRVVVGEKFVIDLNMRCI